MNDEAVARSGGKMARIQKRGRDATGAPFPGA